jgi:hypothetical protein
MQMKSEVPNKELIKQIETLDENQRKTTIL